MCDISLPIGAFQPTRVSIPVSQVISIGDDIGDGVVGTTITASVAVKIDSFSLMVVAYTSPSAASSIGIVSLCH